MPGSAGGHSAPTQVVQHRALLTGCAMTATLMQILDSTIANVALPYMQGSLSTTFDQVTWVLTSYVIASAIMTAPVGWMAQRYGRKNLFIVCIIGFTATSMLCGAAQSLEEIVLFRILQGAFGAALSPLSQAVMLDIYSFEQRAHAMAIFGMGIMLGPIMGPTLGGYLTEALSWRWVFYVNLPFGIIAVTGIALFMPRTPIKPELRFDWTGFAVLALGIGALQLMLDRGQSLDWMSSPEIVIEMVLAGLGFYLFVVHMFTAKKPFLPLALFMDRNFAAACLMMFCTGTIMMASSALLAPFLQNLAGYPVAEAGRAMAPRGFGTMVAMVLASRLGGVWVDQRKLMAFGLILLGATLHFMSTWSPDMSERQMVGTLIVQGFAMGFIFNPMTVIAFATLPPSLRGDAAALQNLARNIGAAIGISVTSTMLTRSAQVSHADMAAGITPFNRIFQNHDAIGRLLDPTTSHGAEMLTQMIERQAQIIAFSNDFRMMTWVVVPPLLLLLFMRRPGAAPGEKPVPARPAPPLRAGAD
jgi:DHA2 family multidrug resistance protein